MDNESDRVGIKLRALVRSWAISRFSEEMAWRWLRKCLSEKGGNNGDPMARVRKWILLQLNRQRHPPGVSHWQRGCPELISSLTSRAVWDTNVFPWIEKLEAAFPAIKAELLALKGQKGFQPYRAPSWASDTRATDGLGSMGHDAGDWNVFYLFLHNMDFAANRALCPTSVSLLTSMGSDNYDHAFFSALAPSTHIPKHHGPTNKKLRCHLPLIVPPGQCRLRVGDETIQIEEGKCYVFDDSFEHEAWNDDATHARIVLIVDVWHPDLSGPEKKFLGFLRNAQLRMGKHDALLSRDTKDNFFTIIQDAHTANLSEPNAIWS